eukprot:3574215-Alexandrium_andersonii.AAC.1
MGPTHTHGPARAPVARRKGHGPVLRPWTTRTTTPRPLDAGHRGPSRAWNHQKKAPRPSRARHLRP